MSLLRIIIGVLIGACFLAGALAAAVRFPATAIFLMFGSIGIFILYMAFRGLRSGVIWSRRSRYERSTSPFGFWFYVLFFTFFGAFICAAGIYYLITPHKL